MGKVFKRGRAKQVRDHFQLFVERGRRGERKRERDREREREGRVNNISLRLNGSDSYYTTQTVTHMYT